MKFTTAAILPLLSVASASCLHGTSLLPRSAHGVVDVSTFNYTGTGGPLTWHGLDGENSACAEGKRQSPIVIETDDIDYARAGSVRFHIPKVEEAEFENLGTTLEVVMTNGSLVTADGAYKLSQFHFHTPSEHRIDDEYYPMEVHFVFESSAGSIAVVGFVFELSQFGYSTPLFDSVFAHLSDITTPGTYTKTSQLDFSELTTHLSSHGIYQYRGSLTTPPCSEGVSWFLSTEPLPVNVQTYNAVKKVIKFNARYTQGTLGQDNLLDVAAKQLD
ncbi:alpha carbonic anhydrase [Aspergillus egyptiacus]|nr:alpha carbonic anhydrase [Aspergillus egyptiacus]